MSRKDPAKTMNQVERAAYKIHHTFFNAFDDIWVNRTVSRRAPAYEPGSKGGDETARLYREKFFPAKEGEELPDYSKLPRHLQFLYKPLRDDNVPDQETDVED